MSRAEMTERIKHAAGHTTDSDHVQFERASLAERTVLGVDPSLGSTGWAVLQHTEAALLVARYGTVRFENLKTTARKFEAVRELFTQLVPLFSELLSAFPDIELALEAPPTGRNKMLDTESTWSAGSTVECAAVAAGIPVRPEVQIQHHKKTITGMGSADKDLVGLCLGLLATSLPIVDYPHRTNNNVRDGISVALDDLHGGS